MKRPSLSGGESALYKAALRAGMGPARSGLAFVPSHEPNVHRELAKRLTAPAAPFTVPAARTKMDANRIAGACGIDGHVVGLLTVLDSYRIKARMPVLMELIFDDSTAEDYQEWKSSA